MLNLLYTVKVVYTEPPLDQILCLE